MMTSKTNEQALEAAIEIEKTLFLKQNIQQ
jgi:hypothetical protein